MKASKRSGLLLKLTQGITNLRYVVGQYSLLANIESSSWSEIISPLTRNLDRDVAFSATATKLRRLRRPSSRRGRDSRPRRRGRHRCGRPGHAQPHLDLQSSRQCCESNLTSFMLASYEYYQYEIFSLMNCEFSWELIEDSKSGCHHLLNVLLTYRVSH